MSTKPGRAPSDYKPKAKVIETQRRMSAESNPLPLQPILLPAELSVDPNAERKQEIINSGVGSKKVAAKLTLLVFLFIGLFVGSIILLENHLIALAYISFGVGIASLATLAITVRKLYKNLVNEFGREETIDLLFSMANPRKESEVK